VYTELKLDLILKTIGTLRRRIAERFPDSGLSRIAAELERIGRETGPIVERARRPNYWLRAVVAVAVLLVVALVGGLFLLLDQVTFRSAELGSLLQAIESAAQDLVFLGIAIWFLFTLEGRLKRRAALAQLHRLRSVVHIVDMHQLTKDPEHLLTPGMETPSSPGRPLTRFELSRYLDYCSELLSLTTKLAALHVQHHNDPVVLEAVNDVEVLGANLSSKIWQKIVILDTALRPEPAP
jgi:hypothetical protein